MDGKELGGRGEGGCEDSWDLILFLIGYRCIDGWMNGWMHIEVFYPMFHFVFLRVMDKCKKGGRLYIHTYIHTCMDGWMVWYKYTVSI